VTSYKLAIHLAGGAVIYTTVDEETIDEDVRVGASIEQYVEKALSEPAKPHWAWLGDAYVFTQAVSAVDVLDELETKNDLPRVVAA
jgi:hypothetical protein